MTEEQIEYHALTANNNRSKDRLRRMLNAHDVYISSRWVDKQSGMYVVKFYCTETVYDQLQGRIQFKG